MGIPPYPDGEPPPPEFRARIREMNDANPPRSFDDWWQSVPTKLTQKAGMGDEQNKPLLNQVNYVLLHLQLSGKHDLKPTHNELKNWLHSGQVDVLRTSGST